MTFLRNFLDIVAGALVSSALGGLFAFVVARISPEFISTLFGHPAHASLVRYALRALEARGFEPLTSSLQSWRSTN